MPNDRNGRPDDPLPSPFEPIEIRVRSYQTGFVLPIDALEQASVTFETAANEMQRRMEQEVLGAFRLPPEMVAAPPSPSLQPQYEPLRPYIGYLMVRGQPGAMVPSQSRLGDEIGGPVASTRGDVTIGESGVASVLAASMEPIPVGTAMSFLAPPVGVEAVARVEHPFVGGSAPMPMPPLASVRIAVSGGEIAAEQADRIRRMFEQAAGPRAFRDVLILDDPPVEFVRDEDWPFRICLNDLEEPASPLPAMPAGVVSDDAVWDPVGRRWCGMGWTPPAGGMPIPAFEPGVVVAFEADGMPAIGCVQRVMIPAPRCGLVYHVRSPWGGDADGILRLPESALRPAASDIRSTP